MHLRYNIGIGVIRLAAHVDIVGATKAALEYLRLANHPTSYMNLLDAHEVSGSWVLVFNRGFIPGKVTVTVDTVSGIVTNLRVEME